MLPLESGLAVLVPGAEALVGSFPSPSAAAGMPAHITLLYPFKPPDEIGDAAIEKLNQCFAGFRAFDFTLATIRHFPGGVLYLAPEPDESFPTAHHGGLGLLPGDATLWRQVFEHNASPNRCSTDRREQADQVVCEFTRASQGRFANHATAREIALMDTLAGIWQVRTIFALS